MSRVVSEKRLPRDRSTEISVDRLRELLEYDPETGELFWKRHRAGTVNGNGYEQVRVDGKIIGSHRIAVALMTGRFPEHEVDHNNRVRNDNRWSNLTEVTRSENMRNTGMLSSNSSGVRGVSWNKVIGKWHARIWVNTVGHSIGYFDDIREAEAAYEDARSRLHGKSE